MTQLRAYWVKERHQDMGIVVMAEDASEAKKLGRATDYFDMVEYVGIRVHLAKDGDIKGLPKGLVEPKEGLRRGLYGFIEDDCDRCKKYAYGISQVILSTGECICSNCEEELESANNKPYTKTTGENDG